MKTMSFVEAEKLSKEALLKAISERRKALLRLRFLKISDSEKVKPDVVQGLKKEIARLKTAYSRGRG